MLTKEASGISYKNHIKDNCLLSTLPAGFFVPQNDKTPGYVAAVMLTKEASGIPTKTIFRHPLVAAIRTT